MSEITVLVTKYADRRFYVMYYECPLTGKRPSRSTKCDNQREAEKVAAKWEAELREGRYKPASTITWQEFRERYEDEAVIAMADNTGKLIATAFNAVERILNLQQLRGLTEARLSHFQAALREESLADASIRSYLAHLKAALGWAVEQKMLPAVPSIKIPKRAKGVKLSKGRAIRGEEVDRMLAKVEAGLLAVTRDYTPRKNRKRTRSDEANQRRNERQLIAARAVAPGWRRLITGLNLSGLRLGEALALSWDDENKILLDLSGRRPMMRIRGELEKGGQDRIHPITPDFYEFLQLTPEDQRRGPVFPIAGKAIKGEVTTEWASKVVSAIGKAAGVIVDSKSGKFASAHDLRRSFGARWARKVMPAVLKELMRHEDISTTMAYYATQDAEVTADAVWESSERSTIQSTPTKKAPQPDGCEAH